MGLLLRGARSGAVLFFLKCCAERLIGVGCERVVPLPEEGRAFS